MKDVLKCRIKPYIQPFERKLALNELRIIAGSEPKPLLSSSIEETLEFEVVSGVPADVLVDRLAYWEYIYGDQSQPTTQVLREATVNVVRNGILPEQIAQLVLFDHGIPLPNRRCLRYGTHGIHEYRGKFFPQLVRALINTANVPINGIVADPMSGSGTTIVEAVLTKCYGLGLDMNPLSVLMGRTKCALLSVKPEILTQVYRDVHKKLLSIRPARSSSELSYFSTLPTKDREYLTGWFSQQVLLDLDQIMVIVNSIEEGPVQDLMRLSLSNIIRRVSWQKDDDLRVRKEVKVDVDIDPIKEFLEELGRSVRTILAFLYQNQGAILGGFEIHEGNACEIASNWHKWLGKVDAIITSPPYATALPYLDTDRLSLCYLGLLPRIEYRERDQRMIGNREITEKGRLSYWQLFQMKKIELPESVALLIEEVERLNSKWAIGFRRRNLPALLAKYFLDMREVLEGIAKLLKPGASAYVIVGNNHTIAGGERVEIATSSLLVEIAMAVGLQPESQLPMEMLVSRDIFKKNAVASEVILSFRRPVQH
jgi:DNA modification methylase